MDDNTRATMFSSASTEYSTPPEIFEPIEDALHLNFDAAASHDNHRTPHYATQDGVFTKHFSTAYRYPVEEDGLTTTWEGFRVWCNPPYGRDIGEWVKKAALGKPNVAALLLPARTETEWFQRWVAPYAEVHFLMGRVKFWGHMDSCWGGLPVFGAEEGEGMRVLTREAPDHPVHRLSAAPFPSIVAVYSPSIVVPQGRVLGRTWDFRTGAFESAAGDGG